MWWEGGIKVWGVRGGIKQGRVQHVSSKMKYIFSVQRFSIPQIKYGTSFQSELCRPSESERRFVTPKIKKKSRQSESENNLICPNIKSRSSVRRAVIIFLLLESKSF